MTQNSFYVQVTTLGAQSQSIISTNKFVLVKLC